MPIVGFLPPDDPRVRDTVLAGPLCESGDVFTQGAGGEVHSVRLPQPEIGYAILNGENYMFPRSDGILLGGTHETGVWSLEPDAAARERILASHREFFDSFRAC